MTSLLDLTYYSHLEYDHPDQLMHRHRPAIGYIDFIKDQLHIEVIKHLNFDGSLHVKGVKYSFFRKTNSFFSIPFKTHAYIRANAPDIILVQGLIFPLQLLFLRPSLAGRSKIIVQHHGEKPFRGIKGWLQKLANKHTSAYIFTSLGNAEPWIRQGIISSQNKCFEILEASSWFERTDRSTAKQQIGMYGNSNFLWVGRLLPNKDPLTVLLAFEKYLQIEKEAKLFMIYQNTDLLPELEELIKASSTLRKAVKLVGEIPHDEMPVWFNAADFYISGSHKEAAGYALLEAMSCGCIPVITDIPPYRKITNNGAFGLLFKAGDSDDLFKVLTRTRELNHSEYADSVYRHFVSELSFRSIANKIAALCHHLTA